MFTMDQEETQVRIVSSSTDRIPCGPAFLTDVLDVSGPQEQFFIQIGSCIYLLLLNETESPTRWTAADAMQFCNNAFIKSVSPAVCLFRKNPISHDEQQDYPQNVSLSLLSAFDNSAASVTWPAGVQPSMKMDTPHSPWLRIPWAEDLKKSKINKKGQFAVWGACLALAIAGCVLFGLYLNRRGSHLWQRYDIGNSNGPRYQLQFDHHNVSSWEARYPSPNDDWFLRIDDQAMIPVALLTDDEMRYQHWFQSRYIEADQIRLTGDYLRTSFLSDPDAIQVPADKEFHMAHCVLALRRYWWAKEAGQHVCPRDIDFKHIQHCLDALDSWAFPGGPRRASASSASGHHQHTAHGNSDLGVRADAGTEFSLDEFDKTVLVWRTKVCFERGPE